MNFKKSNSVNYLSIITLSLLASYELKAADAFEPSELEGLWTFDNACEIDASGMCQARTFSITDHCDVLEGTETNYVERDANGANDYSGACNHGEFSGRSNALPDGNYRYYDTSPPNIGLATATISSVNFFGQDFKILDFAPMESQVEGYPSEPTTLAFNMRLDARIFKRIMVNDDLDKDTSGMLWPNNGCVLDNVLGKTSADTFSFSELICHDNPLMVLGSENYIRIDLIPTCEDPSDGCQGQSTTGEIQATIKLGDEQPLRLAYDLYTDTEATFSFDALPAWFEESHHIAVSYYPGLRTVMVLSLCKVLPLR